MTSFGLSKTYSGLVVRYSRSPFRNIAVADPSNTVVAAPQVYSTGM